MRVDLVATHQRASFRWTVREILCTAITELPAGLSAATTRSMAEDGSRARATVVKVARHDATNLIAIGQSWCLRAPACDNCRHVFTIHLLLPQSHQPNHGAILTTRACVSGSCRSSSRQCLLHDIVTISLDTAPRVSCRKPFVILPPPSPTAPDPGRAAKKWVLRSALVPRSHRVEVQSQREEHDALQHQVPAREHGEEGRLRTSCT